MLAAGAAPDRISYGNTIKKERDIARAFALGVRLFAVDCKAEVEKIARAAPGAKVFCRFLFDCAGAEWPLSRKFGCDTAMAVDVLEHAHRLGLEPHGGELDAERVGPLRAAEEVEHGADPRFGNPSIERHGLDDVEFVNDAVRQRALEAAARRLPRAQRVAEQLIECSVRELRLSRLGSAAGSLGA